MAMGGRLSDLSETAAVDEAMAEFQAIGRTAFLERYGFRPAREFFVIHRGRAYDSKALAAAAYHHQTGKSPLEWDDFSGGEPVIRTFESMGFHVGRITSPALTEGEVYTRQQLRAQFSITDSTINNGFFRPHDTQSIWLFVTGEKTAPEQGKVNAFDGDLFYWLGQNAGRTDAQIVGHEADGREILLFYRTTKAEYAGGGFKYFGPFRYISHTPGPPSRFVLQRIDAQLESTVPDPTFDPTSIKDGRERILAEVKIRQGQPAFRKGLLQAYNGRCAVTGCSVASVLEAAHIHPYRGAETNHVQNGILLRADIHTLFDLGLIVISADRRLSLALQLADTEYANLHGQPLALPKSPSENPSGQALEWHRNEHVRHARLPSKAL
jgi:hypothetical protein